MISQTGIRDLNKRESIFSLGRPEKESKRYSRIEEDPLDIYIPSQMSLQNKLKDTYFNSTRLTSSI